MVDVSFDGDEEVVRRISSVNCQVDEKSVVKKLPSRKSHRANQFVQSQNKHVSNSRASLLG